MYNEDLPLFGYELNDGDSNSFDEGDFKDFSWNNEH